METTTKTASYIIVVGPGTYLVASGHYTRDHSRAAVFATREEAEEHRASGWRIVEK